MAEYFWGNAYLPYNQTGWLPASFLGNTGGPFLRGYADTIRGTSVEDGGNPNQIYLVFYHQNVERRGAVWASQQVTSGDVAWNELTGWEMNQNPDMVRSTRIGPVKVYVLQDDTEGGVLTITPNEKRYPVSPENERGSYEDLMSGLEVTAQWVYAGPGGDNAEPALTRKIRIDDPRLAFTERGNKPVIIDNKIYTVGQGMQQIGFWKDTENSGERTLRFTLWPGSTSFVENTINLELYDPGTTAAP